MPIMRTPPPENTPGHFGEYEAYKRLIELDIPDLELWFNLELPTVPEIDLIINHPRFGAYIVEIKGMRLDEIRAYTPDRLDRIDGKQSQQPVKQVKNCEFGLRGYLGRHADGLRVPYLQRSVLWPRITRAEWNARFNNPVVMDQAFAMIYADDLINEFEFESALATVTQNPLGAEIPMAVRTDQPGMKILRILTNYDSLDSAPIVRDTDVLTNREIEELAKSPGKSDVRIRKYPADSKNQVVFRGFPGSGKTTALRDLGLEHARAGNSVLYICFNKVLATKVRQEVSLLLAQEGIKEALFTVADQFQLYRTVLPTESLYNKQRLVDLARIQASAGELPTFDTILLDEAQDIDGEFLDFLETLRAENSSLFYAFAEGQQLYNLERYPNGLSPQLETLLKSSQIEQFNRVFRTGPTAQLICAAVADYYPNEITGAKWLEDQLSKRSNNTNLTLDFENFEFEPTVSVVDLVENEPPRRALLKLVDNLVDASRDSSGNLDGLIIVGGTGSRRYQSVIEYLKLMEIPYADLLQDGQKRNIVPKDAIKVSTYQGARGLTCTNTLVLDSDYIEEAYTSTNKPSKNNVFNIALSRATQKTVVYTGFTHDDLNRPKLANYLDNLLVKLSNN